MKLPTLLVDKFRHDHKLNAFVSHAIGKIAGHIQSNDLIFFPEYTDHGLSHLEATLQTAIDIANPESKRRITEQDAATLIVAASLHDLGMYLTRDGFESLIAHNSKWAGIPFFDKATWEEVWSSFYAEATRFDGRKLKSLFGEHFRPVRPLPLEGEPWEDFDYLLVGEFLRRNHPRLAHEIAVYGLPGKNGAAIPICNTSNEEEQFLADICGLVARSHGIDLRTCIDYLAEKHHNKVDPRRVHVIFLAVLLRIADYFQLQASRAPTERTDVTSFRSGLSENEWRVHQSVIDINNTGSDPEAIVVNANPGDVVSFLRLKEWLEGIQQELDRSWAILGEVFGLHTQNGLNSLGIKIRRVRSNLDNVEKFAELVNYVPAKISFEAANADLLKLLVAPLYGDSPSIGLRELFQNAIDAVREFDDLIIQHPHLANVDRYEQSDDVLLLVETAEKDRVTAITLTDRGVGMTPQIIQEYFLRAGASFRKSDTWKREHENPDGHSRILRTGRFGVGALAAFLLGDEIEIITRHAQAKDGVKFFARLDDERMSLQKTSCPVGTKIHIKIPEKLQTVVGGIIPSKWEDSRLHFGSQCGHYFLKKPSLRRVLLPSKKALAPIDWLPQPEDGVSSDWRTFKTEDFERVFWSYKGGFPAISCNGIVISAYERPKALTRQIATPNVSVFDKDGYLPVNLQRTGLQSDRFPFHENLVKSVTDDLIAYAFAEGPEESQSDWFKGVYPGFRRRADYYYYNANEWADWVLTPTGFVLNNPGLIKATQPKYLVIGIGGSDGYNWADTVSKASPAKTILTSYLPSSLSDLNNRIKGLFQQVLRGTTPFFPGEYETLEVFIPEVTIKKIKRQMRPGKDVRTDIELAEGMELSKAGWRYANTGSVPKDFSLKNIIGALKVNEQNPMMFVTALINEWNNQDSDRLTTDRWLDVVKSSEIPFEKKKRSVLEKKLPNEIKELLQIRRQALKSKSKSIRN